MAIAEAQISVCDVCGKEISDKFWKISGYSRNVAKFSCSKCGKEIEARFDFSKAELKITRSCSCVTPIILTETLLEELKRFTFKERRYVFCNKCFKKFCSGLSMIDL